MSETHPSALRSAPAGAQPSWPTASNWLWIVAAITAVAAVVRAYGLSGDLYADEVWIVDSANASYPTFLKEVMADWVHPPLFFFLMYGLDAVFGIDGLTGRMVAVISGVISVPVIFWIGTLVHSQRAGSVAAILLALSPIHVWHSQYGRHYSLMVLLVLLSTACFLRVWREPKALVWSVLYILSTVALVYTHYFGWIVVMCQGATFLMFRFIPLKHWLVLQLVLILSYVPWLIAVIPVALAGPTAGELIPQIGWMDATSFLYPVRTIIEFNGPIPTTAGKVISLLLLAGIGALAFLPVHKRAGHWRFVLFLMISVALPFVLVFGISRTVQPMWLHRVMMISLPAYYLIIGVGSQCLPNRALATASSGAAISWMAVALAFYLYQPHRMPYEEVAAFLEETATADTPILAQSYYLANTLREYYARPGNIYELGDHHISVIPDTQVITTPDALLQALAASDTVIVVSRYPLERPIQRYLDANYRRVRKEIFVGKGEDSLYRKSFVAVIVYEGVEGSTAALPRSGNRSVGTELRGK